MQSNKHKIRKANKNHQVVSGWQYNNPTGFCELLEIFHEFLDEYSHEGQPNAQYLNRLINIEQTEGPKRGYAKGIRQDGRLQCLLVARIEPNLWFERSDCNYVCLLKRPECDPKHVAKILRNCEIWAEDNGARSCFIETWMMRPAYVRWAKRLKYNERSYVLQKELK
jgi:hypothetical protein